MRSVSSILEVGRAILILVVRSSLNKNPAVVTKWICTFLSHHVLAQNYRCAFFSGYFVVCKAQTCHCISTASNVCFAFNYFGFSLSALSHLCFPPRAIRNKMVRPPKS